MYSTVSNEHRWYLDHHYGTTVCIHYLKGYCKNEQIGCNFFHPVRCKYYDANGSCKYRNRCNFAHIRSITPKTITTSTTTTNTANPSQNSLSNKNKKTDILTGNLLLSISLSLHKKCDPLFVCTTYILSCYNIHNFRDLAIEKNFIVVYHSLCYNLPNTVFGRNWKHHASIQIQIKLQ